jgi:hypothetical protein
MEVQVKQHVFFNAGSETAAEQTELIIDVVKVIANVLPNLWTSARRDEKPREAGREMHAEACILEQSLLEMAPNGVCKCELVEAREDTRPSSKNVRSMQGTLSATSAPIFF